MRSTCREFQAKILTSAKIHFSIQIGYDDTWYNEFSGDTSAIDTYLNGMVTHIQAHYCLASLGTKIQVEVSSKDTHIPFLQK